MEYVRTKRADGSEASATDLVAPALGGHRVLVVDSDPDTAATTTALLRLNGFDARSAHSGAAALEAVATNEPAILLIDLDLPDTDPCHVIRRVRARQNPPTVLVVTGHTDLAHRRAATEAGAAVYLLKPTEPSELVRQVVRLCPPACGE